MDFSIEFLLRLLDVHPLPLVDWDDLQGRFAAVVGACQAAGFLSGIPRRHPVPSCPHCGRGVPYPAGERLLCDRCYSVVDPRHLKCWELNRGAFLEWLRAQLHLTGGVRRLDEHLWQLGTHRDQDGPCECFYAWGGPITEGAAQRLAAFRSSVVLYGLRPPPHAVSLRASLVSIVNVLGLGKALSAAACWASAPAGAVRFDPPTGRLEAGGVWFGQVPPGSREHAFLSCLASRQGAYVPYADLKREVLRCTGGADTRDEASFCHRLKSRLKQKFVPRIDAVLGSNNRADGYLLLDRVGPPTRLPLS